MKKPKIKKRRGCWIIRVNRENIARCYSIEAARLWWELLGRSEKTCTF